MATSDVRQDPCVTDPGAAGEAVSSVDVVFPDWANHHGTLFAGRILELVSRAAFTAASRATRKPIVLARIIEMEFLAPVYVGELVVTTATLGARSRRSQLVQVRAEAEEIATGARRMAVRGTMLMVIVPGRSGPPTWSGQPASLAEVGA